MVALLFLQKGYECKFLFQMLTANIMKRMSLCLFGFVFFLPVGCAVGKQLELNNIFIYSLSLCDQILSQCTFQSLILMYYLLYCIFSSPSSGFLSCAKIYPDSIKSISVELGKKFTAVCTLDKDSVYSADDITWFFANVSLPRESYTKVNQSAVALTVNISSDMSNPLKCKATKQTFSYEEPCTYGIYLEKGCKYFFPFS